MSLKPRESGPEPAPVRSIAARISARSVGSSRREAAAIQPSTCSGLRAPTIAPVTPGQASVQATATAETETPCRAAIGRSASRSARLRERLGSWNCGPRLRQSSEAIAATRSFENASVRMPDCIGL